MGRRRRAGLAGTGRRTGRQARLSSSRGSAGTTCTGRTEPAAKAGVALLGTGSSNGPDVDRPAVGAHRRGSHGAGRARFARRPPSGAVGGGTPRRRPHPHRRHPGAPGPAHRVGPQRPVAHPGRLPGPGGTLWPAPGGPDRPHRPQTATQRGSQQGPPHRPIRTGPGSATPRSAFRRRRCRVRGGVLRPAAPRRGPGHRAAKHHQPGAGHRLHGRVGRSHYQRR